MKLAVLTALAATSVLALALPAAAAPPDMGPVRAWRLAHEKQVLADFMGFLAMPNDGVAPADLEKNSTFIEGELRARGFAVRILRAGPGKPPVVYGELKSPRAKRTVVFYAHYDGQPTGQPDWKTAPFTPVLRGAGAAGAGADIDWKAATALDPEWRVYGRSSSDDKASIQAMLSALDALKAAGRKPSVNVKVLYEGEEEQGSPNLEPVLKANADLLKSDLFVVGDGPAHQSGPVQVTYGARGVTGVDMTVYGPARPLHDGHYGNWAPNPAAALVRLLASMRDDEGHILIPGFYDDVRPLSPAERAAVDAMPPVEEGLKRDLRLGRSEGQGRRLAETLQQPALNIRGVRVGDVGAQAANAISTQARASIDFRLVPGQTPDGVRARLEGFLSAQGWTLVDHDPSPDERMAHPRVIKLAWEPGYAAWRTPLDQPAPAAFAKAVEASAEAGIVRMPMMGGSVPMVTFAETLRVPVVGLAFANADNNQHAANENLRLANLWRGIEVYAGVLEGLDW
jgi:acetylornithine deacetylase/succinyl-diaminopimelate desuccinylase-like protein